MSMKRKTLLCAAIAAAIGIPAVHAAGQEARIGQSRIAQPAAEAQAGARVIVKYRSGTLESTSNMAKARAVESAAARAGAGVRSARGGAVSATHMRRLGVGADLLRLSQKLERSALETLVREISADPAVEYAVIDERDYALGPVRRATDAQPQFTPDDPFFAQYQWNFRTDNPGGI
ncbi:protease, partial [Luteimonas sp. SJ-92]|nr:protease [Luteimonas salinisoli]